MLYVEGPEPHDRKRESSTPRHSGKLMNPIVAVPIEDVVVGEDMVTGETPEVAKDQDCTISINPEIIVTRTQQRMVVITSKIRTSGCAASPLRIKCALISFCCVEDTSFEYDRTSIYNVRLACERVKLKYKATDLTWHGTTSTITLN